ncbi:MAG TPA: hypothetical protein VFN30_15455 [Chitinophagaceae bacterium]|nr:hypothetical protein [Chitinophagaceae bacterium]
MVAPILFIIFNRPDTTAKVFEAIRLAKPSRLYIAADAPRNESIDYIQKCRSARSITEHIDWPCKVKRLYQEANLGCSLGPRAAFDWFFSQEQEGIILEDDCMPHPDFFVFASEMLERYRNDKKVISINGSNLGYKLRNGNSYTFSRYMNMWGWATWADRAVSVDYTLQNWRKIKYPLWFLYRYMRQGVFDIDINWYKYWRDKFDRTISQPVVTWWDWQWIYHQTVHQQLSIVPAVNLVTNIGFNENATHTHQKDNPAANIPLMALNNPLVHPDKVKPDYGYEEECIKWIWCYHKRLPTIFYLKQFVGRLLGRNA